MCHAVNLFFEARGEPPSGKEWVMDVVRNRVHSEHFPSTYCGVITDTKHAIQFEWYGRYMYRLSKDPLDWGNQVLNRYSWNKSETKTWYKVYREALYHYLYDDYDNTNNALFYRSLNSYKKYGPFKNTALVGMSGNHVFFKTCIGVERCLPSSNLLL